jgi:hypothetical protein
MQRIILNLLSEFYIDLSTVESVYILMLRG